MKKTKMLLQNGQSFIHSQMLSLNKVVYTATSVACGWAGAVIICCKPQNSKVRGQKQITPTDQWLDRWMDGRMDQQTDQRMDQ